MTQPTQELPPYLSALTFTTVVGGSLFTSETLVEIPLTYFGPSIPLGTNGVWVFGGSTSPPPLTPTTSATSTLTTRSFTSSLHSTTNIPAIPLTSSHSTLTSSPSSGVPSSISSNLASSASASSAPVMAGSNSDRLHRALPGIIIGSIAGFLLLLLLIYMLYRRLRPRERPTYNQDNFSDYLIVGTEGQTRLAGEGVARLSGGEEDSFLRSASATKAMHAMRAQESLTERLINNPLPTGDWVLESDYAMDEDNDEHGTLSPATDASRAKPQSLFSLGDRGLFYDPEKGPDPTVALHAEDTGERKRDSDSTQPSSGPSLPRGPIMPTHQLLQLDDEWQKEHDAHGPARPTNEMGERTPLRPPPVLSPDRISSSPRQTSQRNSVTTQQSAPYAESPYSDPNESAALLTARRINLNEGGPGTLLSIDPSSSMTNLGLRGLARLRRLSWFQQADNSRSGSPQRRSFFEVNSRPMSAVFGLSASSDRPLSYVSGQSLYSSTGNTVYHDALSSMSTRSGTPLNATRPSSPVRVHTPITNRPLRNFTSSSALAERSEQQPLMDISQDDGPDVTIDVLDLPVPAPVSPFSSTSSRGGPLLPPGLESLMVPTWSERESDMPSDTSLQTGSVTFLSAGSADVLEDEPPRPGEGWASLRASTLGTETGRRTTLGQPIITTPPRVGTSEQGSLHSMPTHLSPLSPSASGPNSRAPSRHDQYASSSFGSASSHPSDRSLGRSGGSSYSIAHSNSLSSDGRRRARRSPGEPSPPPRGYGYGRASLTATGRFSPRGSQRNVTYHTSNITDGTTTVSDISGESHVSDLTAVQLESHIAPHNPLNRWTDLANNDSADF